LKSLFPRPVDEVWLEIGFGGGEHLAAQAERHPEIGFIGSELFVNGIARLVAAVADGGLDNVRIFDEDARLLLPALPEAGLGRAFVLFPDPWPKHRHAARRFVSRANLEALAFALADGAELWLASDDMGQARWILAQATAHPAFRWLAARARDWRAPPAGWRATRYEEKGIKAGRKPLYFRFERRPRDAESAHKRG
jgi:tRNA (guanine-N7-)-methyltransferase